MNSIEILGLVGEIINIEIQLAVASLSQVYTHFHIRSVHYLVKYTHKLEHRSASRLASQLWTPCSILVTAGTLAITNPQPGCTLRGLNCTV